jgi:hypothetical protein
MRTTFTIRSALAAAMALVSATWPLAALAQRRVPGSGIGVTQGAPQIRSGGIRSGEGSGGRVSPRTSPNPMRLSTRPFRRPGIVRQDHLYRPARIFRPGRLFQQRVGIWPLPYPSYYYACEWRRQRVHVRVRHHSHWHWRWRLVWRRVCY